MIDWLTKAIASLALVFGATLITIPERGSVNLIEAIWTLTGIITLAFSLYAMPKVLGDYFIVKRIPGYFSDARTLLARGHVRREAIRLAQGAIITFIGIYAALQPAPLPTPTQISIFGLILTVGLVALGALVAVQSVLDSRQRMHAERLVETTATEVEIMEKAEEAAGVIREKAEEAVEIVKEKAEDEVRSKAAEENA